MLQEAKTVCDYLIVCIQTDPSHDRKAKNTPVQSLLEREIQITACRYVDEVMVYDTEADLIEILDSVQWDVRILGDEYQDKEFTGRDKYLDKCYFNKRPHTFSSSELRERVAKKETKDNS